LRFAICDLPRGKHVCHVVTAALVLVLITLCFPLAASAETLLRWKFAAGEQWQVSVDQRTTTETTGAGKPTGIDITLQMVMTWKINSVDDQGTAQIIQRIERFAVTMKSGTAEPIEYASDSEKKPSGPAADIAAAVAPVVGAEFTVTITGRGAIRDVKLSESTAAAFAAIDSQAFGKMFSPEGIARLLSQAAVEFPEAAIDSGGNWSATSSEPSRLGTLVQERTYTLAEPQELAGKQLERIDIAGTLEIKPSDASPSELKLLAQSLAGTMLFDLEAGRLSKSESTQKLTTERPYREFKIKVETTASTTTTISSL